MVDAAHPHGDGRIPVSLGPGTPCAGDALLVQDGLPAPDGFPAIRFRLPAEGMAHAVGCPCCAPRNPAAAALGMLFRARARGEVPWFERVLALADARGRATVIAALTDDLLVTARFVEAPALPPGNCRW